MLLGLSPLSARGAAFSPKTLFARGEKGVWFDPTDRATLFQDTAGTTPSGVGQIVGRINDKSGNGKNALQSVAGSCPTVGSDHLAFAGTDNYMATAAIDFTGTDAVTIVSVIRKLNDTTSVIVELSADFDANNGAFLFAQISDALNSYSKGTAPSTNTASFPGAAKRLVSQQLDISSDTNILRVDGAVVGGTTTDQGTGNFGNYVLNLGARGGSLFWWTGQLCGLVVIGRALTGFELRNTEAWMSARIQA